MKIWVAGLLVIVGVAVGAGGGYWLGHRGASGGMEETPGGDDKKTEVTASVVVASIRKSTIAEQITSYGAVVAPANEVRVVSVPFESRVTRILVSPGETVAAGTPLIEVEGSAATMLALEEAQNTLTASQRDLQLVKGRIEQRLATNSELYTAENAMTLAKGRLASLQKGGAGGPRELNSEAAGIVGKVDVQVGQVVAIGSPLVEVAAHNQIEVKLGVGPQDITFLKSGEVVHLHRISDGDAPAVDGRIRLIGQRVDPMTRLVDVMVSLPPEAKFILEEFVMGLITKASTDALVAPREAVLPDENGYTLFTVKDGKAVKHSIRIGLQNDRDVQVIGDGLQDGEPVVVIGNYELQDGMAVQVQRAETQPSTDASAPEVGR